MREFCALAFAHAGLDMDAHVVVDPSNFRPAEVDYLRGDAAKAGRVLGWAPQTTLEQLVAEMVEADLARLQRANRP